MIYETKRLSHVHWSMKVAMKKGIVNIQLTNGPIVGEGNGKDGMNGG